MKVFSTKGNRVVSVKEVDSSYTPKYYEHITDTNQSILFKIYDASAKTFTSDSQTESLLDSLRSTTETIKPITVSPVEFKLLWTLQERIDLKTLRETDAIIDDFFSIIEDPRLTVVNLNLNSTIEGVNYAVDKLVTNGTIDSVDHDKRVSEILSGTLQ